MEKKLHAIFVDKNYKFDHYKEFSLGENLEKIDGSSEYRYFNKDGFYQKIYYQYWSSWDFEGFEGFVFISENVSTLFEEFKCGIIKTK